MEKIIQIISSIDSETQKTFYIGLTSDGRICTSFNLKKWRLKKTPDLKELKVTEEEPQLHV